MDEILYAAIGLLLALAAFAAVMDRRQNNRADLDRVPVVSWPLILVLSMVGALMATLLVFAG